MRIEREAIKSRLGRRMLTIFVLCALVPITVLAAVSYIQVTRHLRKQAIERLDSMSEFVGQLTIDYLARLLDDVTEIGRVLARGDRMTVAERDSLAGAMADRFQQVVLIGAGMDTMIVFGSVDRPLGFTAGERAILGSPDEQIIAAPDLPAGWGPLVSVPVRIGRGGTARVVGRLHPGFVFHTDREMFELATGLSVFGQAGNLLYTSYPTVPAIDEPMMSRLLVSHRGELELLVDGRRYVAAFWTIPLTFYRSRPWKIILSESTSSVLSPLSSFRYYFILIVLVCIWVVLLLSIAQIRRSLVPLRLLKQGTERIAGQDFQARVEVHTRDEFNDLAVSFNTMAAQLNRQFNTLTTIGELDRAVLSTLKEDIIIETVLTRTFDVLECDGIMVLLVEDGGASYHTRTVLRMTSKAETVRSGQLSAEETAALEAVEHTLLAGGEDLPFSFLGPLRNAGLDTFLLAPLRLKDRMAGVLATAYQGPDRVLDQDAGQARQIADRFTVALSNARLVEELDNLSTGTLSALARAIDAKSHWTAGHSSRVTDLARALGTQMGLDAHRMEVLRRGGMLHDIGKIGISGEILDKRGRLTDEERLIVQSHTTVGARILQPIPVLAEAIPIVLQHHERFDGSGYPHGAAGDEIDYLARILAVADFYDALTSDRPYRAAYTSERVLGIIEEAAGRQFDPAVVISFLEMIRSRAPASDGAVVSEGHS